MTKPNYMEGLLEVLRDEHGVTDPETLALIREELIRSFKNGIMRGRELARSPRQEPKETKRTR
jgi:hypothetical protein